MVFRVLRVAPSVVYLALRALAPLSTGRQFESRALDRAPDVVFFPSRVLDDLSQQIEMRFRVLDSRSTEI